MISEVNQILVIILNIYIVNLSIPFIQRGKKNKADFKFVIYSVTQPQIMDTTQIMDLLDVNIWQKVHFIILHFFNSQQVPYFSIKGHLT